ncbi:erg24, C-14 sterol reductase [Elasticomyces elasticus]|nr:erg24, C-14 sterol reductase [Elasticomyces elasticus]
MASNKVQKHGYEFGGPIGASLITFGLPVGCYAFAFLCNDISGCPVPSLLHPSNLTLDKLKRETGWPGFTGLLNTETVIATLGYYLFSLALYALLPGQEVQGTELRSGGRLKYKFNAFYSALFTLVVAFAGTVAQGSDFPLWTFIDRNYIPLLTSNILISYALATYVYVASFDVKSGNAEKRELAAGGFSGNVIYDWFIGRELNPRVNVPGCGEVDIKTFMELRPGMLGWILLNLAYCAKQYGTYGTLTDSILLVTFSQTIYVLDALYMESAILTTIDITTDGFGFMLAFGDLAWLPFTYSLQARYLSVHPVQLGITGVAGILAVQAAGYYIFRASNSQKNMFRTNPDDPRVKHLKYIQTSAGSRLLTTGWWGQARHINYLGDWLMSWAYCLPTGVAGYIIRRSIITGQKTVTQGEARGWGIPITYFFMLYFAVLLMHRERRDEEKCKKKYGKDWEEYCRIVKWRILPGVY